VETIFGISMLQANNNIIDVYNSDGLKGIVSGASLLVLVFLGLGAGTVSYSWSLARPLKNRNLIKGKWTWCLFQLGSLAICIVNFVFLCIYYPFLIVGLLTSASAFIISIGAGCFACCAIACCLNKDPSKEKSSQSVFDLLKIVTLGVLGFAVIFVLTVILTFAFVGGPGRSNFCFAVSPFLRIIGSIWGGIALLWAVYGKITKLGSFLVSTTDEGNSEKRKSQAIDIEQDSYQSASPPSKPKEKRPVPCINCDTINQVTKGTNVFICGNCQTKVEVGETV